MNKAVIFDLDGTLIDSVPDIAYNINLMLKKYGYPLLAEGKVKSFVGHGARNLVKDCIGIELTEGELDERLNYYNNKYTSSGSPNTKLFDGIDVVLKTLKQSGYKLAILTNKPQETTDNVVRHYLNEYGFDKIVGQSGSVKCKPDKSATIKILNELDVEPQNAYFVGDGDTDVVTSKNSGTKGIAALWGYSSKQKLSDVGATVFAKTPMDLLNLIV